MKKNILGFVFLAVMQSKAQTVSISFETEYVIEYLLSSKNSEDKMNLLVGKSESLFLSKNKRFNDSIINKIKKSSLTAKEKFNELRSNTKKNRYKYKILKKGNKIYMADKFMTNYYFYEENQSFNWKMKRDTLTIAGFLCNKAIVNYAGRNYEAWYTKELPISEGPYKFKGLPGLIIKIYDTKKDYIFEIRRLVKSKMKISFNSNEFLRITKKELFDRMSDFRKNPIPYLQQTGIVFNEELKQRAKQRAKTYKTNELELKIE